MEGFCVDVQRIILRLVCGDRVSNLNGLFRVNHLFRRWVTRYVIETANKSKSMICFQISKCFNIEYGVHDERNIYNRADEWNLFCSLSTYWENRQTLFASYIMYLDARRGSSHHVPKVNWKKRLLFERNAPILRDYKKRIAQHVEIVRNEKQIRYRRKHIYWYDLEIRSNQRVENAQKKRKFHTELLGKNEKRMAKAFIMIQELDKKYKKRKM